jgi:hypothetical protein
MGARFLTAKGWKSCLEDQKVQEITTLIFQTTALSQWADEIRQIEPLELIKAWCRFIYSIIRDPAARKFTQVALTFPRSIFSLFKYFGYGLYAGRK